jgi:hypothetical protein
MPGSPGGRGGQLILRIPLMLAAAVLSGRRDRAGASAAASASSSAARWALELGATARNPGFALS